MALERTTEQITGNLYYGDSLPTLARNRTDVEGIKALNQAKEEDYLTARQGRNVLESTLKKLPYLEKDREVYNSLSEKTNEFISSLDNEEALEDSVLDVDQFAHNFANKLGGNELIKASTDMNQRMDTLNKAYESGEIKDSNMLAWYKKQVRDSYEGIKTDEETGEYLPPRIGEAKFSKFVDIPNELNNLMKGWKEDGFFEQVLDSTGRPTGKVKVNRSIPGYLNYTSGTEIDEQELMNSALAYVRSRPDAQSYLDDRSAFLSKDIEPTIDNLKQQLTPEMMASLTGVQNPTDEEIQSLVAEGKIDIDQTIKAAVKSRELMNSIALPVQKFGFRKEVVNTLKDHILTQELKNAADLAKSRRAAQAASDKSSKADISIHKFITTMNTNPANVKKMREDKKALKNQRTELQAKITQFKKQLAAGDKTIHSDQLVAFKEQQGKLDEQIESLNRWEENLTTSIINKANTTGLDLNTGYNNNLDKSKELVKNYNMALIASKPINISEPNIIEKDGKRFADIGGNEVIVLTEEEADSITNIYADYIVEEEVNGKVERNLYLSNAIHNYDKSAIKENVLESVPLFKGFLSEFLDENGESNGTINHKGGTNNEAFRRIATEEEYNKMVADAYSKLDNFQIGAIEGESLASGTFTGVGNASFSNSIVKTAKDLRDKIGLLEDLNITRDMSYLLVNGDTTKDALRRYNNYNKSLNEAFKTNPESFKVGDVGLGQYLDERYDIDNMAQYINWNKSKIVPLLERDRNNGQMYGISIVPTKEGLNISEVEDAFGATNTLKVSATYTGMADSVQDNHVQEVLLGAFSGMQNNLDREYNVDVLKEAGLMYINADPSGKALDDLNLYTLNAGNEATWNVEGQNIKIKALEADVRTRDLLDVDFITETRVGGKDKVLAYNDKNQAGWVDKEAFEADITSSQTDEKYNRKYRQVIFNTPSDMKKLFGATLLNRRFKNRKNKEMDLMPTSNPSIQYQNTGYSLKTSNDIQTDDYNKVVSRFKNNYKDNHTIKLKNNKNKDIFIDSRVPLKDLVDLRTELSDNLWDNNRLPYINKQVYPYAKSLANDYGIKITGGFRGEITHNNLDNSDFDSPHKYGFSLDIEDDEKGKILFNELKGDPSKLQQYNIQRMLLHDGHVHLVFGNRALD